MIILKWRYFYFYLCLRGFFIRDYISAFNTLEHLYVNVAYYTEHTCTILSMKSFLRKSDLGIVILWLLFLASSTSGKGVLRLRIISQLRNVVLLIAGILSYFWVTLGDWVVKRETHCFKISIIESPAPSIFRGGNNLKKAIN